MTFDEVWSKVKDLPDTALLQIPSVLSESTKKRLEKRTPSEVRNIISEAIEEVNRGSVEPIDVLVRKKM